MSDDLTSSGPGTADLTPPPPPPPPPPAHATQLQTDMAAGKTIAAIAKERSVDLTTVIATLVGDENAEIDAAAKAGTITSAQATQMKAQTTRRVTDMVNGTEPEHGSGGHGGPGAQAEDQQVIATAIGISTNQLQTELTAGKTIAAIATAHSKTAADVISALVASENAEIDQRAASGQITPAQAAQDKTLTQQRVTDMVDGTHPTSGPPRGGWGPPVVRPVVRRERRRPAESVRVFSSVSEMGAVEGQHVAQDGGAVSGELMVVAEVRHVLDGLARGLQSGVQVV